jgi:hypothetical protein
MRSFVVACVAAIVIAVGAALVLDQYYQEPASSAYSSTSGVRL